MLFLFSRGFALSLEKVADLGEQFFLAWAFGGGGFFFWFGSQFVDELDAHENGEGDDGEVDHRLNKLAVHDGDFGRIGGLVRVLQNDRQLAEVDSADENAQRRHDDIVNQRRSDFAEGTTDDHTDGEVDNIAAHGEGFEFGEEGHGVVFLYFRLNGTGLPFFVLVFYKKNKKAGQDWSLALLDREQIRRPA